MNYFCDIFFFLCILYYKKIDHVLHLPLVYFILNAYKHIYIQTLMLTIKRPTNLNFSTYMYIHTHSFIPYVTYTFLNYNLCCLSIVTPFLFYNPTLFTHIGMARVYFYTLQLNAANNRKYAYITTITTATRKH